MSVALQTRDRAVSYGAVLFTYRVFTGPRQDDIHESHGPLPSAPQGSLLGTESIVAVISFSSSPFIFTSFYFLFCLFTPFQNDVNGVGNPHPFFPSLSVLGLRKPVIFPPISLQLGWPWDSGRNLRTSKDTFEIPITKRHHWFLPVASFLD